MKVFAHGRLSIIPPKRNSVETSVCKEVGPRGQKYLKHWMFLFSALHSLTRVHKRVKTRFCRGTARNMSSAIHQSYQDSANDKEELIKLICGIWKCKLCKCLKACVTQPHKNSGTSTDFKWPTKGCCLHLNKFEKKTSQCLSC